jgi:hypothetical protein
MMTMKHTPFEGLAAQLALHVDTVTRAEEHAEVYNKPKARRKAQAKPKPVVETTTVTVDPEVLATALKLAGYDARRLEIQPDGSVLVLNNPRTDKPQPNR